MSLEWVVGSEPIVGSYLKMGKPGVKNTVAYKIIRQMTDHIWGSDEELEDSDVIAILQLFQSRNQSWQALINGSMDSAVELEECIEIVIKSKREDRLVSRVAQGHLLSKVVRG